MAHFRFVLSTSILVVPKKNKGAQITYLASVNILRPPGDFPKRSGTLHPSACAALPSVKASRTHLHTGGAFCRQAHFCRVYCPCVRPEWRPVEVFVKGPGGIRRSLKITGPSAATPPSTPPADEVPLLSLEPSCPFCAASVCVWARSAHWVACRSFFLYISGCLIHLIHINFLRLKT